MNSYLEITGTQPGGLLGEQMINDESIFKICEYDTVSEPMI
jgi:hypothetical protein